MPKRIPTEDLLNELHRLADELDGPPTQQGMREYGNYSTKPYKNRWGSWNEALRAAGFSPNKEHGISDADLLREINRLGSTVGKAPTVDQMKSNGNYDPSVYQERFGSWNEALRAAGFLPNSQVSEEDLLSEIRRLADGQEPPTSEEMRRKGAYTPKTYHNRFGSWNEAVSTAGFLPNQQVPADEDVSEPNSRVSEEDLLSEIHRLADGKEPPTNKEMREKGSYSPYVYYTRFGSWNNAIRTADYSPRNNDSGISIEQLLAEISRLSEELGHSPTAKEMRSFGQYSPNTYQERFHSWWTAVVKAGYKPQRRRPLCPEAIHQFHKTTLQQPPRVKLIGLLFQFTGITPEIFTNFSDDWIRDTTEDLILSVPMQHTKPETGFWEFRLQEEWTNPHTEQREKTQLPEMMLWYLDSSQEERSKNTVVRDILRIAREAELFDYRTSITYNSLGTVPRVRPVDLRITHGINLARNGAPTDFIKHRLGIDQIEQQTDIEELLIWLAEKEGINHPEYQS